MERAILFRPMSLRCSSASWSAALLLAASGASAQEPASPADPPIETDRPGNGNAATTAPQGRLQIESGVNYSLDRPSGSASQPGEREHQLTFPTALRLGVTKFLELRGGTGIVGIELTDTEDSSVASTDTSVGTKVALLANDGWTPALALMTDVFLPSGSGAFTRDVVVPEVRGAAFWNLPAGFGLLLNAGGDLPANAGDRALRSLYVVHVNHALSAFAGDLTLFVESFGRVPFSGEHESIVQIDLGFAWRLSHDWQIDAFTQHGITEAAPDFQAALGLNARF